jgi:hypothetical protein
MNRQHVMRRLRYLRNWEFLNIFLLPAYLYSVLTLLKVKNWQPYALAMGLICFILAQGVFYWHLKLQAIDKNTISLPAFFYPIFSFFKWANLLLLLTYPVLLVYSRMEPSLDFRVSIWSNLLFLFGVLEYVNYYYYQLSHDNLNDIRYLFQHRKLRKSPIYMDMQRSKRQN